MLSVLNMSLYEVADYFVVNPSYSPYNFLAINMDTMNSLSAEQQQIIRDAARYAQEQSILDCIAAEEKFYSVIEANGGTCIQMTEEEFNTYFSNTIYNSYPERYFGLAASTGTQEDAIIVINAIYDYFGYDLRVEDMEENFKNPISFN